MSTKLTEHVHPARLRDVAVERRRVELREHEDPPDVCVEAFTDGDVDETVLAADWNRWFRPRGRQRKQA
jgi:hypothetical protein